MHSWKTDILVVLGALRPIERKTLIETVLSKAKGSSDPVVQAAVHRLKSQRIDKGRSVLRVLK